MTNASKNKTERQGFEMDQHIKHYDEYVKKYSITKGRIKSLKKYLDRLHPGTTTNDGFTPKQSRGDIITYKKLSNQYHSQINYRRHLEKKIGQLRQIVGK
jgi:hypothetical protein